MDRGAWGATVHRVDRVRYDWSDLTHTYINILEWVAFPPPEDLPDPGIKPTSPALQVGSLLLGHQKSPHYDIVPSRRYSRNCHSLSSLSSLPCSPLAYQNCSLFLCVLRALIHAVTLWFCGRDSSSYFHLFPSPPAPRVESDMEQTQTTYYSSELMNHLESL